MLSRQGKGGSCVSVWAEISFHRALPLHSFHPTAYPCHGPAPKVRCHCPGHCSLAFSLFSPTTTTTAARTTPLSPCPLQHPSTRSHRCYVPAPGACGHCRSQCTFYSPFLIPSRLSPPARAFLHPTAIHAMYLRPRPIVIAEATELLNLPQRGFSGGSPPKQAPQQQGLRATFGHEPVNPGPFGTGVVCALAVP